MTKDRTGAVSTANALKMAIEALSQYTDVVGHKFNAETWGDIEDKGKPARDAINACKEALAEAEKQTLYGKEYMEGFNAGKMFAELEHTAQEPVAIVMEDSYGYGASLYKRLPLGTKLYTHPATWQSLSDDEIRQIIAKEGIPVRTGNTAVRFARAIEQAHGIV